MGKVVISKQLLRSLDESFKRERIWQLHFACCTCQSRGILQVTVVWVWVGILTMVFLSFWQQCGNGTTET